jgi:histidinol-phosphate aminotransferase
VTARTRLRAVANPNNPPGSVVSPGILVQLAQQASQAAVLVDEAYFEFYGESLIAATRRTPNLFVARTFSKAYGLAGLRSGVLIGNEASMRDVRRVASPYSVNNIALACLPVAIADQDYVRAYANEVREQRSRLQSQLSGWGLRYWPSQANFVLLEIGPSHRAFVDAMRDRGILVRDRSSDPSCDGCVRITLGLRDQTDRLIETMHDVLTELGLLRERVAQ